MREPYIIAGNVIDRSERSGGNGRGVTEPGGVSYTLTTSDRHAIAFAQNTRDEVRLVNGDGSISGALAASPGMKQTSYILEGKADDMDDYLLRMRAGKPGGGKGALVQTNISGTLGTSNDQTLISPPKARRLTPLECERLQGFPDDWTRIPYRGKPAEECPNAPRYKAMGNSFAVPVVRWIAERILASDAKEGDAR